VSTSKPAAALPWKVRPVSTRCATPLRHLNFFQHECVLEVRTPRVKLPDGSVYLVKPPFAGWLSGFTLPFEALVLMLAPQVPMAAVARTVGISVHRATQRQIPQGPALVAIEGARRSQSRGRR
jgi:hypothetical protein